MRVFNKGKRAIIINRSDNIQGCRLPKEHIAREQAYIDPDTEVEIKDNVADVLLKNYPKELVKMGSSPEPKPKTRRK